MKRKLKFKDDVPVFIWLGKRGWPWSADKVQFFDDSIIHVERNVPYKMALDRIKTASKFFVKEEAEKFMYALVQYMDDEDEDNFFLMLMDFNEWHKVLEVPEENETL